MSRPQDSNPDLVSNLRVITVVQQTLLNRAQNVKFKAVFACFEMHVSNPELVAHEGVFRIGKS